MALPALPAIANPPTASPEAFNKSRRVNPSDIIFFDSFIFSPLSSSLFALPELASDNYAIFIKSGKAAIFEPNLGIVTTSCKENDFLKANIFSMG
jgi:hypothetical protein